MWCLLNFGTKSKQYNKIQPKVESYDEPPHQVCEICNDSGECLNNIHSPFYDGDDMWGKSDYLDCWVYIRNKEFNTSYEEMFFSHFVSFCFISFPIVFGNTYQLEIRNGCIRENFFYFPYTVPF